MWASPSCSASNPIPPCPSVRRRIRGSSSLPRKLRLTVYTSEGDKTVGMSEWLMGSLHRMGRIDEAMLSKEQLTKARPLAGFAAFVQVTQTAGFIGHSYFVSDPAVSADLVSLVRYGLEPGVPGRPLDEISRPFWRISPGTGPAGK